MGKTAFFALIAGVLAMGARPGARVVMISGFKFEPAVIHAHVGDTIVWSNRDVVPHTARTAKGWDTGDIPANATRRTVMRKRGEYSFDCAYHSNMKGRLVVR